MLFYLQFHFHTPSEHAINGQRTEMEVHFVHKDNCGRLAVLGYYARRSLQLEI
jgi:carbonic anhydrase